MFLGFHKLMHVFRGFLPRVQYVLCLHIWAELQNSFGRSLNDLNMAFGHSEVYIEEELIRKYYNECYIFTTYKL